MLDTALIDPVHPDSNKIVFSSGRSGTDALWTINANGTTRTQLTKNPNVDDVAPI